MILRRNALWNLAGSGVPLIAAFLFIPFTLNYLGGEVFGVLTLIWALIGYFSLFDMGVGRALTYELSKLREGGNDSEVSSILRAGMLLTFLSGLLGASVIYIISPYLSEKWLKISPNLQQDVLLSFKIAALGVIPTTIVSGLRGALEGLGYFSVSNISKIFLGVLVFVFPPIAIVFHGSHLWIITIYLVIARLVVAIYMCFFLSKFILKSFSGCLKYIRSLLRYGVWVSVTGIVGPLMVYGDRFFVSAAVGATLLPIYAIPQEGLQRLLIIPNALCGALLPQLVSSSPTDSRIAFIQNYKRVTILMFCMCAFVGFFAYPAMSLWLSSQFADQALPVVIILIIGIWFNSMAQVPYTLIHAKGRPKITAIFHLFELFFYGVILWWLSLSYGLVGAAMAWVFRAFLDLCLLHFASNIILKNNL